MHKECSIAQTVDIISKKWTLLILLELYKSPENKKRYSQLKKSLADITPKVLSTRLKELEHQNFIIKHTDTSSIPISCTYQLTQSGEAFIDIIKNIKEWTLSWRTHNKLCETLNCKDCPL